jgi:hypothetical protein
MRCLVAAFMLGGVAMIPYKDVYEGGGVVINLSAPGSISSSPNLYRSPVIPPQVYN